MSLKLHSGLSRRERQIMDVIYRLGSAGVSEVRAGLPNPPTDAAVRRLLAILVEKGHVRQEWNGPRSVYLPVTARSEASREALERVTETFFDGSALQAAAALIDLSASRLSDEERETLAALIDKAQREGR
jgi:predicted transcriptional regulator